METRKTIDRMRAMFGKSNAEQDYEPLETDVSTVDDDIRRPALIRPDDDEEPFSWVEYSIFLMLGIAMLWAWYVVRVLLGKPKKLTIQQEHVPSIGSLFPVPISRQ